YVWLYVRLVSPIPCQNWMRGRPPVNPGSALRTLSPHCMAVVEAGADQPYAPPPVHAPAGTPASDEAPANTSGYAASRACAMHAPDDRPAAKTRFASALFCITA